MSRGDKTTSFFLCRIVDYFEYSQLSSEQRLAIPAPNGNYRLRQWHDRKHHTYSKSKRRNEGKKQFVYVCIYMWCAALFMCSYVCRSVACVCVVSNCHVEIGNCRGEKWHGVEKSIGTYTQHQACGLIGFSVRLVSYQFGWISRIASFDWQFTCGGHDERKKRDNGKFSKKVHMLCYWFFLCSWCRCSSGRCRHTHTHLYIEMKVAAHELPRHSSKMHLMNDVNYQHLYEYAN